MARAKTQTVAKLDEQNGYQMTLDGLLAPYGVTMAFDVLNAVAMALLGHPWLGVGYLATVTAGLFLQRKLARRWLERSTGEDERRGFIKVSLLMTLRCSLFVAWPLAIVLMDRSPAALLFFGTTCACLVALGVIHSSFSRLLFFAMAAPIVVGIGIAAAAMTGGLGLSAVMIALATLATTLGIICFYTNQVMTQWRQASEANAALIADLGSARDQAFAARDEASQANRAKSAFLATMSHEIRTPLNGVLGMAELLRRNETDPVQAERIETLIGCGEYLLSILNDVLDVSKIDAGRLEITPAREDLAELLRGVTRFWSGRADEKGLRLDLALDPETPRWAMVDAVRLRQILFNLVGNALKFTEAGGVTLSVAPAVEGSNLVRFTVRDTGCGIAPNDIENLFQRFRQADDADARRHGGTGLGLAICKQLAELMGGRIWVESCPGLGSYFHVELPLEAADEGIDAATGETAGEIFAPERLHVLAVDDNPVNLKVLEQLLGAFGYRIETASGGAEALERLAAGPFDLVVLDIQMPEISGLEVVRRLRAAEGPNRHAPVVALTADVMSGGRERYMAQGFTDHASKPIEIGQLMAAIARAMQAAPAAAETVAA